MDCALMTHDFQTINVEVGKKIRQQREKAVLRQKQIATCIDVSSAQYQKYESGQSQCSIENLYRISNVLGCPVTEFLPDMVQFSLGFQEQQAEFITEGSAEHVDVSEDAAHAAHLVSSFNAIKSPSIREAVLAILKNQKP